MGRGYDKRFRLVHVGCRTQRRTVKGGGRHFADIVRAHRGRLRNAACGDGRLQETAD